MSLLLESDTYASVHSLFEDMTCHLAVVTVLAGSLKGRIYVDDPARPRTAILLPSNRHRVYVSGEPEPYLLADVIHLLSKESLEESYRFVMYDNPFHSWQPALEQVLQKQEIHSSLSQQSTPPLRGIGGLWHNTSADIVHDASCGQIMPYSRGET